MMAREKKIRKNRNRTLSVPLTEAIYWCMCVGNDEKQVDHVMIGCPGCQINVFATKIPVPPSCLS